MDDDHGRAPRQSRNVVFRRAILVALSDADGLTRSELSARTGMSRSGVASAVAGLVADHLVSPAIEFNGDRGRPAQILRRVLPTRIVVAVDFGHTHVAVLVATSAGVVLSSVRQQLLTDERHDDALAASLQLITDALAEAEQSMEAVSIVGVGVPAPIDARTGMNLSPTIMPSWHGGSIRDEFQRRLGVPVLVANDSQLGALGEYQFGAGRGCPHLVYVKVSHGVGAGVIVDGALMRGARSVAGEIGHLQVDSAGPRCRCGNRGCLEPAVSVSALRRHLHEAHVPGALDETIPLSLISSSVPAQKIL